MSKITESRPIRVRDCLKLPGLVEANRDELIVDFPGVVARYAPEGSMRQLLQIPLAARALRRAQMNPDLRAYAIQQVDLIDSSTLSLSTQAPGEIDEAAPPNPLKRIIELVGLATIQRANVQLLGPDESLNGALVAGWLDKQHQGRGIGSSVAAQLLPVATEVAKTGEGDIFTVIRPDNEASIALAQEYGFAQIGRAGDYGDLIGDGVSTDRVVFSTNVDRV